ncbi:response regulator [Rhodobium gokarnense]|uniref:DNA-binding response OmpR family regulator n=1 Tax=Rhodobium gokarnense TaxID=364296 RepID=A0ABT3HEU9_9HYPH|nr:response regulator transcription factor [Rhodobium gokarnense]MCW2308918.1 DNA-binding response OmpR family regulator [Rhodobium gokarnense]
MADHILVVDDDPQITDFLQRYLTKLDYRVTTVATGEAMLEAFEATPVDLVILDIGLPDRDGFELTQELRRRSNLPIVVLSARDEAFDRVIGLEFGADDYVTKPFEPRELAARIKSVLRRYRAPEQEAQEAAAEAERVFGPWSLKLAQRALVNRESGMDAGLTTAEFDILAALLEHPGAVLSRNQLLDIARGRASYVGDRSVDVHIMRLRRKIEEDPANPRYVKTVHGVGYVFPAGG